MKSLLEIQGVGLKQYERFKKNHIYNTYDLFLRLPKKYENFEITQNEDIKHDDIVTLIGRIITDIKHNAFSKPSLIMTQIGFKEQPINLVIFNRSYLSKVLKKGQKVLVKGKYDFFKNQIIVSTISLNLDIPQLKPIYQIDDIPDAYVYKVIKEITKHDDVKIYETLPNFFIKSHQLISRDRAFKKLHFPESKVHVEQAQIRMKYEEALMHQLRYKYQYNPQVKRARRPYDLDQVKKYIETLPFQLTKEQKNAVNDIYRDFKKEETSYRLIQGDVGSGKTIIAFLAALGMISAGEQVAFMAPTQILAKQQYEAFIHFFKDIKAGLLTSQVKDIKTIKEAIGSHDIKIIFGTHALIAKDVSFAKLGLIIIDEQQRFGVNAREALMNKSLSADTIYLTATPIPRSLALTLFGYIDVTTIQSKPKDRKLVETKIIHSDMDKILGILLKQQKNDEQSFVVTSAIDADSKTTNLEKIHQFLSDKIDKDHLYIMHGKLTNEQQATYMEAFKKDEKGILIATSMIEVGIDIPNATAMIIMQADDFGLSQLHQLRGRIGRGQKGGICYLYTEHKASERLNLLTSINDGFTLSQYDLKLRGPGSLSQTIQSGFIKFDFLDLVADFDILMKIKPDVEYILNNLKDYPHLEQRIKKDI